MVVAKPAFSGLFFRLFLLLIPYSPLEAGFFIDSILKSYVLIKRKDKSMTKTLDEQIQIFISNNQTLRKIKNEENYPYKQIQELRYNLNSLFIACLINKVSSIAHFTIRKFSLDGRLRFIVTENNHEPSKEINQHSVTYAYLIADYINKYLDNQYELNPENISCAYDKFAETWTLTTDIPAL